jgi:hypothetical protein
MMLQLTTKFCYGTNMACGAIFVEKMKVVDACPIYHKFVGWQLKDAVKWLKDRDQFIELLKVPNDIHSDK